MKFTVTVERKRTIVERATYTVEAEKSSDAFRSAHTLLLASHGSPNSLNGKWTPIPDVVLHKEGYWTAKPYDLAVRSCEPDLK